MLFSDYFKLNTTLPFEFFDINVHIDTKRFVDPYCINQVNTLVGNNARQTLELFMSELLRAIKSSNYAYAQELCKYFNEPTGTRLGYSKIKRDGHGAGSELSNIFLDRLKEIKEIVEADHLTRLEETLIVCDRIGYDIISDITINIIKHSLIVFTQEQCIKHRINLKESAQNISYFCKDELIWKFEKFNLPHIIDTDNIERFLILVPKHFLPERPTYNSMYFYNNIAQDYFKEQALLRNSSCVSRSKSGERRVLTKDLKEIDEFKPSKNNLRSLVLSYPSILKDYREKVAHYIHKKSFN